MSQLREMNQLAQDAQTTIHCGCLEAFADWIGAQAGMREMPEDEKPLPLFAGVEVMTNPLLARDEVAFQTSTGVRIFNIG